MYFAFERHLKNESIRKVTAFQKEKHMEHKSIWNFVLNSVKNWHEFGMKDIWSGMLLVAF